MKSVVLYISESKLTSEHQLIQCRDCFVPLWVRTESVNADALHALEQAKALHGETVLNSYEVISDSTKPKGQE